MCCNLQLTCVYNVIHTYNCTHSKVHIHHNKSTMEDLLHDAQLIVEYFPSSSLSIKYCASQLLLPYWIIIVRCCYIVLLGMIHLETWWLMTNVRSVSSNFVKNKSSMSKIKQRNVPFCFTLQITQVFDVITSHFIESIVFLWWTFHELRNKDLFNYRFVIKYVSLRLTNIITLPKCNVI